MSMNVVVVDTLYVLLLFLFYFLLFDFFLSKDRIVLGFRNSLSTTAWHFFFFSFSSILSTICGQTFGFYSYWHRIVSVSANKLSGSDTVFFSFSTQDPFRTLFLLFNFSSYFQEMCSDNHIHFSISSSFRFLLDMYSAYTYNT